MRRIDTDEHLGRRRHRQVQKREEQSEELGDVSAATHLPLTQHIQSESAKLDQGDQHQKEDAQANEHPTVLPETIPELRGTAPHGEH